MSAHAQPIEKVKLKKSDFVSNQTVRWCPGCGDYSILANVQKVMPELNIPRENIVFISGIGCSSRFPYYMNTYGFHTIHGRAPAFATGLKLTRPELSVWLITGDGDAMSIGGNHFMHILRRNLDVNILLFNNRIYGLTKGQYSPTSEQGKVTKSTPVGSADTPLEPIRLALASEASFVARSLDVDPKGLQDAIRSAHAHKGTSLIEIYQNCNIFNDEAFTYVSERSIREERMLRLEHGKPLIFGKNRDKGIRFNGCQPQVVTLGDGITEADLIVHDATNPTIAQMLSRMNYPEFPVPMGVFQRIVRPTYETIVNEKVETQMQSKGKGNLHKLLNSGNVWEVGTAHVIQDNHDEENILNNARDVERMTKGRMHKNLMEDAVRCLNPPPPLIVGPNDKVSYAIQLMQEKNYGCIHIVENERLLGIFTDNDIVQILSSERNLHETEISEVMIHDPVYVNIDDSIAYAFNKLAISGSQHLPVLEGEQLIGFTSARGLLAYINGLLGTDSRT